MHQTSTFSFSMTLHHLLLALLISVFSRTNTLRFYLNIFIFLFLRVLLKKQDSDRLKRLKIWRYSLGWWYSWSFDPVQSRIFTTECVFILFVFWRLGFLIYSFLWNVTFPLSRAFSFSSDALFSMSLFCSICSRSHFSWGLILLLLLLCIY